MEFYEKLQELRKSRGLTQEELAESIFVSRSAISKWESGRGYPSIDLLKEISKFFSVTIDELLSGEKLISIAKNENKTNIQRMCDWLMGIVDVFSIVLIFLPLYPNPINGYIYSVNLFNYTGKAEINHIIYWIAFLSLVVIGFVKILITHFKMKKTGRFVTGLSMGLSIITVLFLAMTREAYAITVVFLLLIIKGILLLKHIKAER